jgi:hypothetical protein
MLKAWKPAILNSEGANIKSGYLKVLTHSRPYPTNNVRDVKSVSGQVHYVIVLTALTRYLNVPTD